MTVNNSNTIDLVLTAGLTTFVISGLILAGMTSILFIGAAMGGAYFLTK